MKMLQRSILMPPVISKIVRRSLLTEISQSQIESPKTALKGRKWLPGSHLPDMPEYVPCEEKPELKIVACDQVSVKNTGREFREYVDAHLPRVTAFLFKNTRVRTAEDFKSFAEGLGFVSFSYEGGSGFRENVTGDIYTASEELAEFSIEPHNEMSYLTNFPTKIMLGCLKTANSGGESPVVFNRELLSRLSDITIEKLRTRKIRYMRNIPHEDNTQYISWQNTFHTQSTEVAERMMGEQGMKWNWLADGDLQTWNVVDATIRHPVTGEEVWFNQVNANHCSYYQAHPRYADSPLDMAREKYHYHCTYADGEEIEDEVVQEVRTMTWQSAKNLLLQPGDILFCDNLLAQHSRMGFQGDRRFTVQLME